MSENKNIPAWKQHMSSRSGGNVRSIEVFLLRTHLTKTHQQEKNRIRYILQAILYMEVKKEEPFIRQLQNLIEKENSQNISAELLKTPP